MTSLNVDSRLDIQCRHELLPDRLEEPELMRFALGFTLSCDFSLCFFHFALFLGRCVHVFLLDGLRETSPQPEE